MALHLLSAAKLAADLADDAVAPHEQAIYLVVSSVAWLVPTYLYISPGAASSDALGKALWFAEFAALVLVNFAGTFYCLRQCRFDPRRHFVIDYACLFAPVTVVVLAVTWIAFYVVLALAPTWWPRGWPVERFLHVHDALVFVVLVGQAAWIFRRVGKYVARVAQMRAGALAPAASAVTLG